VIPASNIDVVTRALNAFSSKDAEAFVQLTTPEIEWTTGLGAIEGEVFCGHEGVRRYFARLSSAWEEFRFLAEDFRERDGTVLVLGRLQGRGRGGGVPVDSPVGAVWDLRDGQIWRLRAYLDHGKAMRAAGMAN
jgi:ketosteroid isomerase-like protein